MRARVIVAVFITSFFLTALIETIPMSYQQPMSQEEYSCLKAQESIKVDGDLVEWSHLSPIQLQWNWQVKGGDWKGPEDLSALCWLTWDEQRLYFAFDIWDDFHQPLLPRQKPWQGEGVLLSLRFPKREADPNVRSSSFESLFLIFNLTQQEGKGVKIIDAGRGFYLKDLKDLELIAKKKQSNEGTIYEGSVPWSSLLPTAYARPNNIEANIIINDIDKNPVKRKSIQWVATSNQEPFKQCYVSVRLLTNNPQSVSEETFDTPTMYYRRVPLVLLHVTVMDKNNNYILDLKKDDFLVYENGQLQNIRYFDRTERPITMAILLDTSGSMQEKIETAQKAAIEFIKSSLRLQDQALVMEFNNKPSMLQDFTNDIQLVSQAINETKAWGGTALYDALYQSMERLRFLQETKAIILLSDGRDESYSGGGSGSNRNLEDVISLARKTDAIIYSIGLGRCDTQSRYVLSRLSDNSGGRCYFPRKVFDLHSVYSQVGEDLRSQYLIGYYPKDLRLDGRWRTIRVHMKDRNFTAKTRKGYFASKK